MIKNYVSSRKKSKFYFGLPKNSDNLITLAVIGLLLFSIFMVPSASLGRDIGKINVLFIILIKQAVYVVFSYFIMLFFARKFNFKIATKFILISYFAIIISLLSTLFFKEINGTHGWIILPVAVTEITLQPAEFAKAFIIFYLSIVAFNISNINRLEYRQVIKIMALMCGLLVAIVLFLQKDLGSAVAMFLISICCFLAINDKRFSKTQILIIKLMLFFIVIGIILLSPIGTRFLETIGGNSYKIKRFLSAANPFKSKYGAGYQIIKGLTSFASGGIFGVGYGKSIIKYIGFYAAQDDFILSIVVAEFGFIGYIFIISMYLMIIVRLFKYAFKIKANHARVTLVGSAMYLVVHFIFNVGGVSALIPLTGVPLLLVSSGGSSMMAFLSVIGLSQFVISKFNSGGIE